MVMKELQQNNNKVRQTIEAKEVESITYLQLQHQPCKSKSPKRFQPAWGTSITCPVY